MSDSRPKKELNLDSPGAEQLQAIRDIAEHYNSDLTHLIGRDDDGKLLSIAVFARGPYAEKMERWLKEIEAEAKETTN